MFQSLLSLLNAGFAGLALLLFAALAVVLSLVPAMRILPRFAPVLAPLAIAVFLSSAVAHAQSMDPLFPPLHSAVDRGDLAETRRLLDSGVDIELKGRRGFTALHEAAQDNSIDIMRLLLDRGANVDARDDYGLTPLFQAVRSEDGYTRGVNLLLDHGANPNARVNSIIVPGRPESFTPLHAIAFVNSEEKCGSSGGGPITCVPISLSASDLANSREIAEALVRRGADLNARDSAGKTPLDYAREFGPPQYAEFFAMLMSPPLSGDSGVIEQIRAEIAALRTEVEVLRALINSNCAGTQPCQGTQGQQERLQGLENQIARKTNQVAALESSPASGGGSGGGGGSGLAIGIGAAALLGIALYAFSPDGDPDAFTLQPSAFYENRNGSETLRYGMRLAYDQDPWRLWWSADDSRFGWGGEWRRDGLRAQAAVWETAETLDLNANLGMEWDWQGWAVRPSWRLRAGSGSSGEWSWDSGADLSAEWARAGWTIRPSVRAGDLRRPAEADFHLGLGRAF